MELGLLTECGTRSESIVFRQFHPRACADTGRVLFDVRPKLVSKSKT
jgi:hypothetical protein